MKKTRNGKSITVEAVVHEEADSFASSNESLLKTLRSLVGENKVLRAKCEQLEREVDDLWKIII